MAQHREYSGRVGQPTRTLRRRDLKPAKEQTDAQLLASAKRAAEAQQRRLARGIHHSP